MRRYSVLIGVFTLVASACGGHRPSPQPPSQPPIIDGRDAEFRGTCAALYQRAHGRAIDDGTATECLDRARHGWTGDELAVWLAGLTPPAPAGPVYPIRVQGDQFVDARGELFVPRFESLLTALAVPQAQARAAMEAAQARGANGIRVFGGHLGWANQTATSARARLPWLMETARDLGLVVELAILTDSREGGYDIEQHIVETLRILSRYPNALPEMANEAFHGTQADVVNDPDAFCALSRRAVKTAGYRGEWALGATKHDGLTAGTYQGACGTFSVAHTQRSHRRELMLDRVYALIDIRRATGKPVISSEPIGADETDRPGARVADPQFFRQYAALLARAGIGGVFHSEAGLHTRPLGAKQRQSAELFLGALRGAQQPGTLAPKPSGWDSCAARVGKDGARALVDCNRYRYARMNRARVVEMLRQLATDLNASGIDGAPFGVLVKTSGNQCNGYSCDIVCSGNGSSQRQWDVLSDWEGAATPVWHEVPRSSVIVRPCEIAR